MKKVILYLVFCSSSLFSFAQTVSPPTVKKKRVEPIYTISQYTDAAKVLREKELGKSNKNCAPELPKVKSDDIIFAKRLTRDIYFADPANRYLVPAIMDRNLIDILIKGIQSDSISAYQSYDANTNTLNKRIETDIDPKNLYLHIDLKLSSFYPQDYGTPEILSKLGLRLIEDWYFDTNRSEFKSFISTIGLIYSDPTNSTLPIDLKDNTYKLGETGNGMESLFYVNYPTVRQYLCQFKVYHPNEKIKYSFDDIFQLRYFSSLIIKESNVGDISIAEMKGIDKKDLTGLDKLLEADRIKKSLIQYEQDMWQH